MPLAKTKSSAGYDVFSNEDVTIYPGNRALLRLGIALNADEIEGLEADFAGEFSMQFYFGLYVRSSVALRGAYMPNGVGVIDMDYRDEICMPIALPHDVETPLKIHRHQAIGQLILHRHYGHDVLGDRYRKDARRIGGFGSTGV